MPCPAPSPAPDHSARPPKQIGVQLAGLVLTTVLAALALIAPARATPPEPPPPPPIQLVLVTAGLTWEDVDPVTTPALQCMADNAGLAAMNTTSTTMVSTRRQGEETIRTGYRGRAEDAPRSAGIPTPAVDQWKQLPVQVREVDASALASSLDLYDTPDGQGGSPLTVVNLDSIGDLDGDERATALRALDTQVEKALNAAGILCGDEEDELYWDWSQPARTVLVSVAATDPEDPSAMERAVVQPSRSAGLQVYMDSEFPGARLSSGSTKQPGLVALTDVAPTILRSYEFGPGGASEGLPGQPITPTDRADAQQTAWDRTVAARMVDHASIPALGSWLALGIVGLVLVLVPAWARRPRVVTLGRVLLAITPLCLPVGLWAQLVPWWRAAHPTIALTAYVWAGSIALSAVVIVAALAGPWRRGAAAPVGLSAALVSGLILLESITGSHGQVASPLGAQPISGGRYYGLSNHLFGLVFAAALMALLCLFTRMRRPLARVVTTLAVGGVVALVCVAPSMGADFGSMLVTVPIFGVLALLVSGRRVRWWHLLVLAAAGGAMVLAVSLIDWLRPAAQRTHLGRFIDSLLTGDLVTVVARKLAQNLLMPIQFPVLIAVLVLAIVASIAVLMPNSLRLRRLAHLRDQHPVVAPVSIALVAGAWLGYAVNDTGPVLVGAVLAVWALFLPALLPAPARTMARSTAAHRMPAMHGSPSPANEPRNTARGQTTTQTHSNQRNGNSRSRSGLRDPSNRSD